MSYLTDCASYGCEATIFDGAVITRISEKGQAFVGLCQDHVAKSGVLKDEAALLLAPPSSS